MSSAIVQKIPNFCNIVGDYGEIALSSHFIMENFVYNKIFIKFVKNHLYLCHFPMNRDERCSNLKTS